MFSRIDATISRDRNLNFSLSDANSMQILDNQKRKETSKNVTLVKFDSRSPSFQKQEKEARKVEYDNYINTFPTGSNENENRIQIFPPSRKSGIAQGERTMKKTNSIESPGHRKLIRTPTQERIDNTILFNKKFSIYTKIFHDE